MTWRAAAAILAGGALALMGAGSARAQMDAAVIAHVTAGATSNPLLAPDTVAVAWDEFTTVRASARGHSRGRRTEQLLSYTYAGTFFANTTVANGQVHQLAWVLTATPTGRTELHATAEGIYGTLNSINPLAAVSATSMQNVAGAGFFSVPTGAVTYVGANGNVNGTYRPDGHSAWSEATNVAAFVPISGDAGRSVAVVESGHHERLWGRNALTLDLMGSYFKSQPFTLLGAPFPGNEMVQIQAMAGWRRDFSAALVLSTSAGVMVMDTVAGNQLSVLPVAFATLHYQTPSVLAEVTVSQSSQLNVYLGQSLLVDGVVARAVLPIDRLQRFKLIGLGTAAREWTVVPSFQRATDLLAADVGLTFTPLQRPFYASLDYLVQDQIGQTVGMTVYPTLHRQMVMLTLTATWGTDPSLR